MPPERAWRVERHDVVDSTMEVAAARALSGVPAGLAVVAEEQTNGRGRRGTAWHAPYGTCLLVTLLLRPPLAVAQRPELSRVIAERVGAAVRQVTGLRPALKDPNDLLLGGRKLAGILCQTSVRGDQLDYLLIGIGLNVNIAAADLPLPTATSLLAETGRPYDRDALLAAILAELAMVPGLVDGVPVG